MKHCLALLVTILIAGCGGSESSYNSAAKKLKENFDVKLQLRDSKIGFARYKNDEMLKLGKQVDKSFDEMRNSEEIVSVYSHELTNLIKGAEILKRFSNENINVYVKALHLVWGIEPGGKIYVLSKDKENALGIIKSIIEN